MKFEERLEKMEESFMTDYKYLIPTWVIALCMFMYTLAFPFAIGVILCIIQHRQLKNLINNYKQLKNNGLTKKIEQRLESDEGEYIKGIGGDYKKINDNDSNLLIEQNKELMEIKKDYDDLKEELKEKKNEASILQSELKKVQNSSEKEIKKLQDLLEKEGSKKNIFDEENKKKDLLIEELKNKINLQKDFISEEDIKNGKKFVLCTGKYKGGIDISIGTYDLKILNGSGVVCTNKPENISSYMDSRESQRIEYRRTERYHGLEITEETILKISDNAIIEFTFSKEYDFSEKIEEAKKEYDKKVSELNHNFHNEKNKIQEEIRSIEIELKEINNQSIEKYYKLSDYDLTSEQCKNEISLLKAKTRELREQEEDIKVSPSNNKTQKLKERYIRQILRCFNSECSNILSNIKLKNIDKCRKDIETSYETLNKLYSDTGISLTNKILKLKLEEASLLYTYELKLQQEREIQREIKEQMIEEAKAQKEIEEQRKKIDKDLQQHIGEVNRLMKYIQKTQIDAEKQLYIDKIKELEDKIKELEETKETVIEREANAKAGFVYIISNIGSFGENIYKIGMTRRLEPMDRIKELSSASVPFEFDVHAMIFSSDAPELESMLHKHFADKAVNKVNPRKEFFHVDIDEIEKVVKENYNDTVQFTKVPVAYEYRKTLEAS